MDVAYRCDECDAEYPAVNEACECAERDRWRQRLADYAQRMYALLKATAGQPATDLIAEIGDPPASFRQN